ncbi:hypothetical protein CAAN1_01S01838 [[Candida] anglica]|uniref:Sporulation-specific protein SPO7 n=1 Tax=[Candida] anglica TaxID=148631 RepID=A0ABP0EJ71_9ASCO
MPVDNDGESFQFQSPHSTPSSPALSASDSLMNITPCTSPSPEDEFVIYSDSDAASQNSLSLRAVNSSVSDTGSATKPKIKTTPSRSRSPRRDSSESTPSPNPKRRIRRKSNKSDVSEKSHRSSLRSPDFHIGAGYTSMPATGKIFRNLLILEESLREQVIQQRALRRKYLTFLAILCSLIASISHHLYFIDPNLSASGAMRVIFQFTLFALLVTLMLYHLSGEYQKTIVVPRKFLYSTNKGLRQLNVRLVKIKTSLTDDATDIIREFSLFIATMCLNCLHKVYPSMIENKNSKLEVFLVSCQSQCQPRIGVTDVKLVLNARVFSTDVREGWELYRSDFWIQEGVRRRQGMMSFTTGSKEIPLDREKLLKKDRKERRDKRKKSVSQVTPTKLSESNLQKLNSSESDSISPQLSGIGESAFGEN